MDNVSTDGYQGQANETTSEAYNSLVFLINQVLSGKWTITLAQVKSVTGGGPSAAPAMVNVQPMVNQTDGQGNSTPHGVINNVPVFRPQGGTSAVVVDPSAGDIGLIACASRDISAVKNNQAVSNPGSNRILDPADALYLGGFLNKAPTQFVYLSTDGIVIQAAPGITITLNSSGIILKVGDNTTMTIGSNGFSIGANGATISINDSGQVVLNGKIWDVHTHEVLGGVGSETGGPIG